VGLKLPETKNNDYLDTIEEKFACSLNLPTPIAESKQAKEQLGLTKSNSNLTDLSDSSSERVNNVQMSKSMTNKTDQTRQNLSYSKEDDSIRIFNAYFD
jgi:hypothetical protein